MSDLFSEKPNVSWKEIVACALFTATLWLLNLSLCFPLLITLMLVSSLRDAMFAWLQMLLIKSKRYRKFGEIQERLFQMLFEEMDPSQRQKKPLRFLELGPGGGTNFKFYPDNHLLTLVDMNPNFRKYVHETLKNYPNIKLEDSITACAEDMNVIKDNEFDVVVATHLLCSVKDVDAVLEESRRVLKPGGKFILLDHIVYPQDHRVCQWIQRWINPLWKVYFNNCHLTRDIPSKLRRSRFSKVIHRIMYLQFCELFFRPHVMAICTK